MLSFHRAVHDLLSLTSSFFLDIGHASCRMQFSTCGLPQMAQERFLTIPIKACWRPPDATFQFKMAQAFISYCRGLTAATSAAIVLKPPQPLGQPGDFFISVEASRKFNFSKFQILLPVLVWTQLP